LFHKDQHIFIYVLNWHKNRTFIHHQIIYYACIHHLGLVMVVLTLPILDPQVQEPLDQELWLNLWASASLDFTLLGKAYYSNSFKVYSLQLSTKKFPKIPGMKVILELFFARLQFI
ncbi:hypothetical protein ACJX0J_025665, partial [Zea mays]